jgi:hypothetical protein
VQASRGKRIRAEPVSALHEQGRLHFVGPLPNVENEITEWNPRLGGVSPNRLDALVWGCWYLARLDEDEAPAKPDPRVGFRGLAEVVGRLRAEQTGGGVSSLTPAALATRASPRCWAA